MTDVSKFAFIPIQNMSVSQSESEHKSKSESEKIILNSLRHYIVTKNIVHNKNAAKHVCKNISEYKKLYLKYIKMTHYHKFLFNEIYY